MMKKELNCDSCLMPIKEMEELRTVWAFFKLRPYHRSCYENSLRGAGLVGTQPINGFSGNFTALVAFILAWLPLFTNISPVLTIVGTLIVLLRLYSFIRFEKRWPH
ncbi:hypothetical protein [Fictibacillus nanhaiensis]|uniref:hypothetical protein n=1 Tax=Fictibacillus nanhaiensis TaxID=742169 RepID=UPI003C2F12B3